MNPISGIVAAQHHLNGPSWATPIRELKRTAIDVETEDLPMFWLPAEVEGYHPEDFMPVMNLTWLVPECRRGAYCINYDLAPLPVAACAIEDEDNDDVRIALLGGGQNMSWHIAAAFMVAGYLPPSMVTRLPWQKSPSLLWRWVIQGCIETTRVAGMDPAVRKELRSQLKGKDGTRKGAIRPGRW